ncbi:MAG: PQQ-binding-like beta-propeller repeat protein, partial [Psychromonas sp.]|nr:PQQ-binding-like beta-propeller repeat protein [Psychromonas sp.]
NNKYWYQSEQPAVIKKINEPQLTYSQACLVAPYIYSDKYVAALVKTEFMEYQLELYSYVANKAVNIESECSPKLFFDSNLICQVLAENKIVSFNEQLQEQWRFELENYDNGKKVFAYQQLVIFPVGEYQNSKQSCIFALDAQTGVERWRFEFDTFFGGPMGGDVTYCALLESYLAVSNKKQILLLNPKTGELARTIKVSRVVPTVCQQLDNKLIVGLGQTGKLEVYDIDSGKKLSTLVISDKYTFNFRRLVIKENNKLYFSMYRDDGEYTYAGEALAEVVLAADNSVINEPALDYQIEELRDNKRNLSHLIAVNESDLGRIQRLLAIAIVELASKVGCHSYSLGKNRVRAHKGHIILKFTNPELPDNALEILTPWAKAIEQDMATVALHPGAGDRHKYQIDVQRA